MKQTRRTVLGDGGVELAVRAFAPPDPNAPPLLLHHGLASSQHIWDLMLPRLTRRFSVVAFDARGHGESGKPDRGYGFDHVVADLVAVADATRLRSPIVIGHSWGAMVALEAVAARPRRFGGAVLVDGGLASPGRSMDWRETKRQLAPPHLSGMPVEEFRGLIRTFFADAVDVTPDVEAIVLSVMRVDRAGRIHPRLSRANHFRILRAIWEQDPPSILRRVRTPLLAISARMPGEETEWSRAKEAARNQAREIGRGRDVRFEWITGIHDVPLQHPGSLCRSIERFVASVVG